MTSPTQLPGSNGLLSTFFLSFSFSLSPISSLSLCSLPPKHISLLFQNCFSLFRCQLVIVNRHAIGNYLLFHSMRETISSGLNCSQTSTIHNFSILFCFDVLLYTHTHKHAYTHTHTHTQTTQPQMYTHILRGVPSGKGLVVVLCEWPLLKQINTCWHVPQRTRRKQLKPIDRVPGSAMNMHMSLTFP